MRIKGTTNKAVIEKALTEKGIDHGGVKWRNIDVWNPDASDRGWMVRLGGKWVRVGRGLKDALEYIEAMP